MWWVIFAVGAALSWGMYGPALFKGQTQLGNQFKALLCVGASYFLIGVLVPVGKLASQGGVGGFNAGGASWASLAGALGAAGAVCIIYAFRTGGAPHYVMPLVFGGCMAIDTNTFTTGAPPNTRGITYWGTPPVRNA